MMISKMQCLERMILQPERFKLMKLTYLLSPVLALLTLATLSQAQGTSAAVTTTFSNMEGVNGELSSVVYSDRSGNPILKNSGFIAIGTFNLERAEIEVLATAADLDDAFHQFGEAANFNSTENGAFQANASGNPAEEYDEGSSFDGAAVYLVIGDGADLSTSSEFLVWKSDQVFDASGPTGGPSELMLSVDTGDLIIGRSDKNTSDFSSIGGDASRAAFTAVMIDESLDDHGNTQETATFLAANSTISGNLKDGDDVDFFRIDLSEDGNLFVKINQNLQLKLYDGEGVLIQAVQDAGDGLGGGVAADFMISEDLAVGTYFVSIAGDENTIDAGYNLESEFEVKIIDLDPESAGSYYGVVKGEEDKFIGHLTITVTDEGYYTGLLKGASGFERSLKGAIQPDYSDSNVMESVSGDLSTIHVILSKNDWGSYELSGGFKLLGKTDYFHDFTLNYAPYSKNNRVPKRLSGRYTLHMPCVSNSANMVLPSHGFAAGRMWSGGWLNLYGRSNTGAKFTYSSRLLAGKKVAFYASPDPEVGFETILGTLWLRNRTATDIDGSLRYSRKASAGGYYSQGFDESLELEGSKYIKPSLQELELNVFPLSNVNAVVKFNGGTFDGLSYPVIFSYKDGDLKNQMKTPQTANFSSSGKITHNAGWLWGVMKMNTTGEESSEIKTILNGVLLQKQGVVTGQAETVDNGVGRFSIVPAE